MKNSNIREKDVEARLVRKVKAMGGECQKNASVGRRSDPDRRVLLFPGIIVFVECKRPGQTWTSAQARERDKLQRLGFIVLLCDSYERVDEIILMLELL